MGPLLFLAYINDIINVVQNSNIRLFADDTCLFIEIDNRNTTEELVNGDLNHIHDWENYLLINVSAPKKRTLTITTKANDNPPSLIFQNTQIKEVKTLKHLGLTFLYLISNEHTAEVQTKANKKVNLLFRA